MSTVPVHTTEKTSEEKVTMKNAFNQNAMHTPCVSSSATLLKNTHCMIVQNNHVHFAPISNSQVMEKNQTVSSTLQDHQITQQKSCEDNTKASTSQATNVFAISDEDESQFDDVIFTKQLSDLLYKFSPLSKNSREEIEPLVEINHIESSCMAEYKNIGWNCIRAPRRFKIIKGDGNCYFRAISYAISGTEDFHDKVRETVCDYIEFYDYDVAPFLKTDQGREYFKKSNMRESSVWAMEMEIMTTAKMFKREVYMWFDNKWLCYSYLREPSKDAIYLNN